MKLPDFFRVTQQFDVAAVADVKTAVREQFASFDPGDRLRPGETVAVAVGSRGTHDLKDLVAATVGCLREMGLSPYIIPAMGSHGGATGPGQATVLAHLDIDENSMGVPVRATMDVVSLGRVDSGAEVFVAQDALDADHIVVVNRVKPHTAFRAEIESGLCKILAVGLGRQVGASAMHKYDLGRTVVPAAQRILEQVPVLCGLAVTENAVGGTRSVRLARPEEFPAVDRELLEEAWSLLPRLPVKELDVLIIDEMGKNVSGAGMDPNVIGAWRRDGGERRPDYRTLVVLDLTAESHGNATGIGMADLTTQRVMEQVDLAATYANVLTSGLLRSARMPMAMEDDRQAVETALNTVADPSAARAARIVNTGQLETLWVTEPVARTLHDRERLTLDDRPLGLRFDANGRIEAFHP